MSTTNLALLSIAEQIVRFKSGATTPADVLSEQLSRIIEHNDKLNVFTHLNTEGAMNSALESTSRWKSGKQLGEFDGISFTVKDNFMVKGFPYRRGSLVTSSDPVEESSPIVDRMLGAGGVLIGLTTMPEFGLGATTNSPLTGITRNPWNLAMHSGGSSGGGSVSVAAGFCTVAVGTDAGGSLRIPAALCGVIGFKPTGASLPVYPASLFGSISTPGPLSRSVEDALIVLRIASLPDVRDPFSIPNRFQIDEALRFSGLKIALSLDMGYAPYVDEEVVLLVQAAAAWFKKFGATLQNSNPGVSSPLDTFSTLGRAHFRYMLRDIGEEKVKLGPTLKAMLEDSAVVTMEQYLRTQEEIYSLAQKLNKFHEKFDLLITPTVAHPAFPIDRGSPEAFDKFSNSRAWSPFTSLFNLTQQPAISVPIGFTSTGLPVGMQIVGARGADALVLSAAAAYMKVSGTLLSPTL